MSYNAVDRHIMEAVSAKTRPRRAPEATQWFYVLALLCLVSLLAFLYLALASFVAREMETSMTLEETIQSIKQENNKLRLAIVLKEDPERIRQEAKAMGFAPPEHMEYLEVMLEEPLTTPRTASNGQPSPVLDASSTTGWWGRLIQQFRDWITNVPETEAHDSP